MITKAPEKIPATPIPAMARPTIKTVLDGATAQIREPISKIRTAIKKPHLTCHEIFNKYFLRSLKCSTTVGWIDPR